LGKGNELKGRKIRMNVLGSHSFCNDITVDGKGSVYITDSANPTILKLSAGVNRVSQD
jgi:hypothetical protein